MNTVERNSVSAGVGAAPYDKVVNLQSRISNNFPTAAREDVYKSSSSQDAVAAKVLSFSIGKQIGESTVIRDGNLALKAVELPTPDGLFDIEEVTKNVLGFVRSSLANFSQQGATQDDLAYFKEQALVGVEAGVQKATDELASLDNEALFADIKTSQDKISEGIKALSTNPGDYISETSASGLIYSAHAPGQDQALNSVSINNAESKSYTLEFGQAAFNVQSNQPGQSYTTQASNISFMVRESSSNIDNNPLSNRAQDDLAELVNQADVLLANFYRQDVQADYERAISAGVSKEDVLRAAKVQPANTKAAAYDKVFGLDNSNDLTATASTKRVSEYIGKLMNVVEKADAQLESSNDYKQIINGLVNQMKDVQVPDLVQAINRFHSFNQQFL